MRLPILVVLTLFAACSSDALEGIPEDPPKPPTTADPEAPRARARLRPQDPSNPSAPYSAGVPLRPLGTVYLDGTASYDPRDPNDRSLIVNYTWQVVSYPAGANPADFDPSPQGSPYFSFWLPLAGEYVVRLTVENDLGLTSADNSDARVGMDVVPPEDLHLQLVWDQDNDIDLHLVYLDEDDTLCGLPYDCHWQNTQPRWITSSPAGTGPNPRLDIDDTNGLGPENINIDAPVNGTYRIFAHYFSDWTNPTPAATEVTLRIYLNGALAATYARILHEDDVWAIADVVWSNSVGASVDTYASDAAGQPGSIENMGSPDPCFSGGWSFP